MDDEPRGQTVAFGDPGIPRLAATEEPTFLNQFWACRPVDGSINPTSTQQRGVGGIHDGIHMQRRNVNEFCPESGRHDLESIPLPAPPCPGRA